MTPPSRKTLVSYTPPAVQLHDDAKASKPTTGATKSSAQPQTQNQGQDLQKTIDKNYTALLESTLKSKHSPKSSEDGLPKAVKDNSHSFSIEGVQVHQPLDRKTLEYFKDNNSKYIYVESRQGRGFVAWNQLEKLNHSTQQNGKQTLSYPPPPPMKEFIRMYMDSSSFGRILSQPIQ